MLPETTLRQVDVPARRWDDYRHIAPGRVIDEALELAEGLRGARVLHVNATSYGGGVAELLAPEIGLLGDAGLSVEWRILCPDPAFFAVTKRIHNGMQGEAVGLGDRDWELFEERNEHCARMIGDEWDLVVVHDPQPAGLVSAEDAPPACGLWRCHIDTSTPDVETWRRLRPYVEAHDAAVFTLEGFRPPDLSSERVFTIPPAIDPLSSKNRGLPRHVTRAVLSTAGIDLTRPLAVQVSRFDPWKDPLGVVAAWRLAREDAPSLQLALVGSMADDDPQAWEVHDQVREATAGEPDCHVLTNQTGIGALEVNAFQREADVIVQKSLREGFGLTVAEALWKRTPVVGGAVGGIPLQLGANERGVLVESVEDCAAAIVNLIEDADLAEGLGNAGHEHVRRDFLVPRLARDDLSAYATLLGADTPPATA